MRYEENFFGRYVVIKGFWDGFVRKNRRVIMVVLKVLFLLYSCLMIWEVFMGPYRSFGGERRYNLYPFATITDYLMGFENYSLHLLFINLGANIITFIPMGFFLTLFLRGFRKVSGAIIYSIIIITIVEAMQFILNAGVFDIDDIILNTLGCLIGYSGYQMIKKRYKFQMANDKL